MSLTSPRYWLKADSGRTSPVNAVTESGALAGGTVTLTEISSGVWAYRCSGALSTASFTALTTGVGGGFSVADGSRTMAIRLRVVTNPSGGSRIAGFAEGAGVLADAFVFCWNGSATFARISSGVDVADASADGLTLGGALKTFVIRITPSDTSGADSIKIWVEQTGRSGTASDFTGSGANFDPLVGYDKFMVDALGGTFDISDAVMWQAGDLTDAECAAAADALRTALAATNPTITGDQGSYSLTGQDASLKATRILTAAQGSYSLSGQDVTLSYTQPGAYTLTAGQGSYTIAGSDGLAQRAMNAAFGSYSLSGQAASFSSGVPQAYTLTASQGAYALTGRSARLLWSNAPITLSSGHSISISISMGVS